MKRRTITIANNRYVSPEEELAWGIADKKGKQSTAGYLAEQAVISAARALIASDWITVIGDPYAQHVSADLMWKLNTALDALTD